jgi:magnesium transporter
VRVEEQRQAVLELLRQRLAGEIDTPTAKVLGDLRPEDIAGVLRELTDADVERVFDDLREQAPELAAEVLPLLERHDIRRVLSDLPHEEVADVVEELKPDDATWVLELLPDEQAGAVVSAMDAAEKAEVQERLEYPEGSAGRLMSGEYIALPARATAGDAIRRLQDAGESVTIVYVYVVDDRGRLAGVVSLRHLLRVKPEKPLAEMTPEQVVSVQVLDDQENVAQVMARNDFVCIPVVDEGGVLVGVVTHDDVMDVMREEATEDMLHMAGTTPDDVIAQSVWTSARLRMPWLLVSLGGGMVTVKLLHLQEDRLGDLFLALALFMPVIVGMGGNVATQAATIVVRGLATGRIQLHDGVPVVWRELRTALIIGLSYGVLLSLTAAFVLDESPLFCVVVGLSLVASMSFASVLGSLVPVAFHAIGVDPAVATGPLVTTAMDVVGILTYLSLAGWLLLR